MISSLDNSSVFHYHDDIRVLYGGQPVRDDKHGSSFHQIIHAALHDGFGTRINRGSCFIQNHNRRVGNRCTRDRNQLSLPLWQPASVTFEHSIIAFRQHTDESVRIYKFCRLYTFLVRRIQSAIADVFHHTARKQVYILKHHAKRAAQVLFANPVDIDTVVLNFAILWAVEWFARGEWVCILKKLRFFS